MKRFGGLARALRLAGSLPLPYPRRGDVATIAAYAGEALMATQSPAEMLTSVSTGAFRPFAFDGVRLVLPTRTLSSEFGLDVGGRHVRLIEVGPAHTPGDLIVWVPDAGVALAADILFIGVTPIMWAGPVERWIASLERLLDLGARSASFWAMAQSAAPRRCNA